MKRKKLLDILSSKKVEYIFYGVLLTLFVVLVTIVSLKHEYWADEANAWLIAADSSVLELFTKYLHTDGHPALFHLIIKAFQAFGLSYDNFRVISILFSTLGVAVFLFKSKFKWYLKALLPFTYFIFYQYTVVTRGYCLVLLLLSLIASIWDEKNDKCILFTIFTILLLSLESYTFFIAGSIYLVYIIDYLKEYKKTKKHNKKMLTCLIVLFFSFLITTIYVMPRSTNTFHPSMTIFDISNSFITTFDTPVYLVIICSALVFLVLTYLIVQKKEKRLEAIIILLPLLAFMIFKYCNRWHTGVLFLLFIFIAWIHKYYKNKVFNIFMLLVCCVQVYWSVNSSVYDYKESYSPAKEVADFVKTYDYKNMKIYGLEFYECAINAYFDENIFYNWNEDLRFFYWNSNSKYYDYDIDVDTMIEENVDMAVVTPLYMKFDREKMREYYDEYQFNGFTYFETGKHENMRAFVYVRKDNHVE